MREFLLGSPLSPALNPGAGPSQTTIAASENGVVHLDRLQIGAVASSEQVGYSGFDLTEMLEVNNLLVNGSIELIRGRNNPGAPGSVFSPLRDTPVINLGDWAFGTGDTVAMNAQIQGTGPINGAFTIAAPFTPRNKRLGYTGAIPAVRQTYAGAQAQGIGPGGNAPVTITFDQDGVADLNSLVVSCGYDALVNGVTPYAQLASSFVQQITLPSGDQLILGQGVFGVSSLIFSATRAGNWWSPGFEFVSAGSQIQILVTNQGTQNGSYTAGMPFYPSSKGGIC